MARIFLARNKKNEYCSSQEMKPLTSTSRLISEKIMKRWRNSKKEKGKGQKRTGRPSCDQQSSELNPLVGIEPPHRLRPLAPAVALRGWSPLLQTYAHTYIHIYVYHLHARDSYYYKTMTWAPRKHRGRPGTLRRTAMENPWDPIPTRHAAHRFECPAYIHTYINIFNKYR